MSSFVPSTLVCYGDLCADLLARTAEMPGAGENASLSDLRIVRGGAAANCAAAAAHSGVRVKYLGLAGRDTLGPLVVEDLRRRGIDISHIRVVEGGTGAVFVVVTPDGEHTMFSWRGVNRLAYGRLPIGLFQKGDILLLSGYSFQDDGSRTTCLELLRAAKAAGVRRALSPSFVFARDARAYFLDALASSDLLIPNAAEARLIAGTHDLDDAAAAMHEFGPRTVVITLGTEGCLLSHDGERRRIPAQKLERVPDTTGAGDSFCGGFLGALTHGQNLEEAAHAGHAAAAHILSGHEARATLGAFPL